MELVACTAMRPEDERAIARLCADAWSVETEPFSPDDLAHAHGGLHVMVRGADGEPIAHAAIVPRRVWVADRAVRAAYVEAVATAPAHRGHGLASAVLARVGEWIRAEEELGLLCGGSRSLYRRHGWEVWQGPSSVRGPQGSRPTPEEDGGIQHLRTRRLPALRGDEPIACEDRPGDPW